MGNRRASSSEILNTSEGMADRMIQVQSINPSEKLEEDVEKEIDAFDVWFQTLPNDALTPAERAILKTYFAWKLGVKNGA